MNGSQIPTSTLIPNHSIIGNTLHYTIQNGRLFKNTGLQGNGVIPLINQIPVGSAVTPVACGLTGNQYVYCVRPKQVLYVLQPPKAHPNASVLANRGLSTGQKHQLEENSGSSSSHSQQAQAPPNVSVLGVGGLFTVQAQQAVQLKQSSGSSTSHPQQVQAPPSVSVLKSGSSTSHALNVIESQHSSGPQQVHGPPNVSVLLSGGFSTCQKQQGVQLEQNTGSSSSHPQQAPPNVSVLDIGGFSTGQKQLAMQLQRNSGGSTSYSLNVIGSQHSSGPQQMQVPTLASNQGPSLADIIVRTSCSMLPNINGNNVVPATSSLSTGQSSSSDVSINGSQCQNIRTDGLTAATRSPPSSSSCGNTGPYVSKSQQPASSEGLSIPASEKSMSDAFSLKHITKISRKDLINVSMSTNAQNSAHAGLNPTSSLNANSYVAQSSCSSTRRPVQTAQEQSKTQFHKAVAIVPPISKQPADGEERKQIPEPFKAQSVQGQPETTGGKAAKILPESACSAIAPPVTQQSADAKSKKLNSALFKVPSVEPHSGEKAAKVLPESGCSAVVPSVLQQCTDGERKKQTPEQFTAQSVQRPSGEKAGKILPESTRHNSDGAKCPEGNTDSLKSKSKKNEERTPSQSRAVDAQPNGNCGELGALDSPAHVSRTPFLKYSLGMLKELVADLEAKNMKQSNRHDDPNLIKTILDLYWGGSVHKYQAAWAEGAFQKILQKASMVTVADELVFDCMETDDLCQLNDRFYVANGDCDVDMSKDTVESSLTDIGEEIGRLDKEPAENSFTSETCRPVPTECKKNGGVDPHIDNEVMKCTSLENPHLSSPPEATEPILDRNNADNSQVGDILKTGNEVDDTLLKSPRSPDMFSVTLTAVSSEDIERFFNCEEEVQMTLGKEPPSPTLSTDGELDSIKIKLLSPDEAKAISKLFEGSIEPSCKSPDTLTTCAGDEVKVGSVCPQKRCVGLVHVRAETVHDQTKTLSDSNVAPCISPSGKSIQGIDRHISKAKKTTGNKGKKPLFKKALSSYIKENTRDPRRLPQANKKACGKMAPKQPHKGREVSTKATEECVKVAKHARDKRKFPERSDEIVNKSARLHGFEGHATVPQNTILKIDVKLQRHESPIKTSCSSPKEKLHEKTSLVSGSEASSKSLDSNHLPFNCYMPSPKAVLYSPAETSAKEKVIQNWATAFVPTTFKKTG